MCQLNGPPTPSPTSPRRQETFGPPPSGRQVSPGLRPPRAPVRRRYFRFEDGRPSSRDHAPPGQRAIFHAIFNCARSRSFPRAFERPPRIVSRRSRVLGCITFPFALASLGTCESIEFFTVVNETPRGEKSRSRESHGSSSSKFRSHDQSPIRARPERNMPGKLIDEDVRIQMIIYRRERGPEGLVMEA